jgi:hypothetical protein
VASHSLPACRGAMVRRRRLYANLGYPVTPRLACMLKRGVEGPIFDRREAVMGLSSWPRTVCQRVGERWCDGAGCMLTSGIRSHRDLQACWRGELMGPIFDRREAVMGLSPWPRTVCQRVGERWCDGTGCLLILGIRSHRCMLVWGGCDPFSTVEKRRWGPQLSSRNLEENADYRGLL